MYSRSGLTGKFDEPPCARFESRAYESLELYHTGYGTCVRHIGTVAVHTSTSHVSSEQSDAGKDLTTGALAVPYHRHNRLQSPMSCQDVRYSDCDGRLFVRKHALLVIPKGGWAMLEQGSFNGFLHFTRPAARVVAQR